MLVSGDDRPVRRGEGVGDGGVALGAGGFGLAHRALGVDAGAGVDGLVADRAAGSGGDRGVDVLGTHPGAALGCKGDERRGRGGLVARREAARVMVLGVGAPSGGPHVVRIQEDGTGFNRVGES